MTLCAVIIAVAIIVVAAIIIVAAITTVRVATPGVIMQASQPVAKKVFLRVTLEAYTVNVGAFVT